MASNELLREELKRQKKSGKKARIALLVIVAIIVGLYVAGIVYFRTHFYSPGTVFGISVQWQTPDSIKEKVSEKVGEYSITVVSRTGEEQLAAADVGLAYDDQGEVDELLADQQPALWIFMSLMGSPDTEIATSIDGDVLSETIKSLNCMQDENMAAPTDAYLDYSDGEYVIRESYEGTTLIYDRVYETVYTAVADGQDEVSLDEGECYEAPDILTDDAGLIAERDALNNALSMVITYDFGDRQMVIDASTMAAWMTLEDDFSFTWDEGAVTEYVYQMAYKTDTMGLSRTFTTHSGSEISLKGGDYGWLMNQTSTTEQLLELLEAGESATVEPVYRYKGICRDENDIGDSYVEVSIADQNMWVYSDGECVVDTPVVTGKDVEGRRTPSGGVWAVDGRTTDYTLKGEGYASHVDYWLPFNGNVGIHDADWRSEFGGTIYKTNGSHGCVNTPPSIMPTVYKYVQIGWPVVVY